MNTETTTLVNKVEIDPTHFFRDRDVDPSNIIVSWELPVSWLCDPRFSEHNARQAIDVNYGHGGGFQPFSGFQFNFENGVMSYPGDPDLHPMMVMERWGPTVDEDDPEPVEHIFFYKHAWVAVARLDKKQVEIARID